MGNSNQQIGSSSHHLQKDENYQNLSGSMESSDGKSNRIYRYNCIEDVNRYSMTDEEPDEDDYNGTKIRSELRAKIGEGVQDGQSQCCLLI